MASITILCPHAHRVSMPVEPNTLLCQVMETACLSNGYNPDEYGLKFHGKWVDLSRTFRLSELPNNATLEMARLTSQEADKSVALVVQFPDNRRELLEFTLRTTLSEVMATFSRNVGQDLLAVLPSAMGGVEIPTLTYLTNKWHCTVFPFTTLKSIGISGKTLLRYSRETMSREQMQGLENKAKQEVEERHKLQQLYLMKRAENEERERIAQLQEKEVNERFQKEIAAKEKLAEKRANGPSEQQTDAPKAKKSDGSKQQLAAGTDDSSRIDRLSQLLHTVTDSLNAGRSDNLVDQLLSNDGRIILNADSVRTASKADVPMSEFADFKFPDQPIVTAQQLFAQPLTSTTKSQNQLTLQQRNAVIYEAGGQATAAQAGSSSSGDVDKDDDSFYEVGIDDIRQLIQSLKAESKKQRDLLPKKFVEEKDRELKQEAYKHTVVRFCLGSAFILQAQFVSNEPVSALFDFIDSIWKGELRFELRLIPSGILQKDNQRTLLDVGIAPKYRLRLKLISGHCTDGAGDDTLNIDKLIPTLGQLPIRRCSHDEANALSDQWLAVNHVFRPYLSTVDAQTSQEEHRSTVETNGIDARAQLNQYRPRGSASEHTSLPKWMRAKK